MGIVQSQSLHKRLSESLLEGQGPAQEQHLPLNLSALCQTGYSLIHHRLKDAGGDILPACSLVQQGLNVGFCKYAAAGGNGVYLLRLQCQPIQLVGGDPQQGCHLVDECPGASGAGAVHTLLHASGQKDDLGILAAQLDHHVCVRICFLHGDECRMHLLHKGQVCMIGKPQPCGAGDAQGEQAVRVLPGNLLQLFGNGFLDPGIMPLISGTDDLLCVVDHDGFYRGGAHVDAQ